MKKGWIYVPAAVAAVVGGALLLLSDGATDDPGDLAAALEGSPPPVPARFEIRETRVSPGQGTFGSSREVAHILVESEPTADYGDESAATIGYLIYTTHDAARAFLTDYSGKVEQTAGLRTFTIADLDHPHICVRQRRGGAWCMVVSGNVVIDVASGIPDIEGGPATLVEALTPVAVEHLEDVRG